MVLSTLNRLKYMYSSPQLDNFIFKLCYRWTVLLLLTFSFIVTCRLLLGDSFSCFSRDHIPLYYSNVKCYADGTFIKPAKLIKNHALTIDHSIEELRRYQSQYSWVNLFFLFQAFNFYIPHLLWKSYESGYLHRLTSGVQRFFDEEEKRGLELCYLAKYVLITQGKHKLYVVMYIFFESWNYTASVGQTLWLAFFFNVTGVPYDMPLKIETWLDFKNFYFPSEGTCEIIIPGPSSSPQAHYSLCEMPLNSLYMKMFLFLYGWYVVLAILCGLVLIYRIALTVPSFRMFVIKSSISLVEKSVLKSLCHRMSYSDWFFLSRLKKTMTDVDFAQMIDKISILSQGENESKDADKRLSFFDDEMKDLNNSEATSPL